MSKGSVLSVCKQVVKWFVYNRVKNDGCNGGGSAMSTCLPNLAITLVHFGHTVVVKMYSYREGWTEVETGFSTKTGKGANTPGQLPVVA